MALAYWSDAMAQDAERGAEVYHKERMEELAADYYSKLPGVQLTVDRELTWGGTGGTGG